MKIHTICELGAGYVGGPTMALIAAKCPHLKVIVADMNSQRIDAWNSPVLPTDELKNHGFECFTIGKGN